MSCFNYSRAWRRILLKATLIFLLWLMIPLYHAQSVDVNSPNTDLLPDQTTGSISGVVYEADSITPIESAWVSIQDPITHEWGSGTHTAVDGSYTLYGLEPVFYHIRAMKDTYRDEWYAEQHPISGSAIAPDTATPVEVVAGQNTPSINFTLEAFLSGSISGQVTDLETGVPIAGLTVALDFDTYQDLRYCTDANGEYSIPIPLDMPFKAWVMVDLATCNGPKNYPVEFWEHTSDWNNATLLTATASQPNVTNINFVLEPMGAISGVVTDQFTGEPIVNMRINADGNAFSYGACTNENGEYQITGIPLNMPFKVISGDNNWCDQTRRYLSESWQESADWNFATILTLTSDNTSLTGINFTLEPAGLVSGIITDQATGEPLANINVNASSDDNNYGTGACTDQDGYYTMSVAYDIPLRVQAGGNNWCGGSGEYLIEYWQEKNNHHLADFVTMTEAQPTMNDLNFTLERAGMISGIVSAQATEQPGLALTKSGIIRSGLMTAF